MMKMLRRLSGDLFFVKEFLEMFSVDHCERQRRDIMPRVQRFSSF